MLQGMWVDHEGIHRTVDYQNRIRRGHHRCRICSWFEQPGVGDGACRGRFAFARQ
jgi:hypothetical protein